MRIVQLFALAHVVSRLRHGMQRVAPLRPGLLSMSTQHDISIVIPARNEAGRISPCLQALVNRPKSKEVIVVDDQSDDDTAAIARAAGAAVVEGRPLPDGWVGKPWAMQQGLDAATGDIAIFLDADTEPRDGLVGAVVNALDAADVVSVGGQFVCTSASAQMLHASFLTTLVYRFGPIGRRGDVPIEQTIANGQCIGVRADWLRAQGGFALSAANMTDDIAFARALAARGARLAFLDGSAVLKVRMHASTGEVWTEWGRSLPMSDIQPREQQAFDLAVLWLTLGLPWCNLLRRRLRWPDRVALFIRWALCAAFIKSYAPPRNALWLSPLSDVPALVRFTQATLRPVRSWRGRNY